MDIKNGPSIAPSDDINLHLSIRPNQNVFVRNHLVRKDWGKEERFGGCPFQYGQRFEILILADMEQFKVNPYKFIRIFQRFSFVQFET